MAQNQSAKSLPKKDACRKLAGREIFACLQTSFSFQSGSFRKGYARGTRFTECKTNFSQRDNKQKNQQQSPSVVVYGIFEGSKPRTQKSQIFYCPYFWLFHAPPLPQSRGLSIYSRHLWRGKRWRKSKGWNWKLMASFPSCLRGGNSLKKSNEDNRIVRAGSVFRICKLENCPKGPRVNNSRGATLLFVLRLIFRRPWSN